MGELYVSALHEAGKARIVTAIAVSSGQSRWSSPLQRRGDVLHKHVWFGIVLAAALSVLYPAAAARAQWVTVAPPESGFSALLPGAPEYRHLPAKPKVDTRVWLVHDAKRFFLIGVTNYDAHIDADLELELDVKNFLTSDKGTLKAQTRVTFSKAPDGPLPAVDFTFTDAAGPGRSLVVVSGDRAYQVVVRAENGYDGTADMARVINSFRITRPSRHWQGG